MGLDITAYRKVTALEGAVFDHHGEPMMADGTDLWDVEFPWFTVYANDSFPGREHPLIDGKIMKAEGSMGFRAGGYCWYSDWRDSLARLAGWPQANSSDEHGNRFLFQLSACLASGGPLWEWLCFSDCEGTIGSTAAKKILEEMSAMNPRPENFADENVYSNFMAKWEDWLLAFEMAADGGCVRFH